MTTIPPFSPGCYGSAMTFNEKDALCKSCSFNVGCKPLHFKTRKAMCALIGIEYTGPEVYEKPPIAPAIAGLIAAIQKTGVDIVNCLLQGLNPFPTGNRTLSVFCHVLLRAQGSVTPDLIAKSISLVTGMDEKRSLLTSRNLCIAFAELGAIQFSNNIAKISKD